MTIAMKNFWTKYGTGSNTLLGTTSAEALIGGAGGDIIDGGLGNDTLTGGAGSDLFVIAKGGGSDTVLDFTAGAGGDVLRIAKYGFSSLTAIQAASRQVGADTVITLGNNEIVTLKNVRAAALTSDNFAFDALPVTSAAAQNWISTSVRGAQVVGTTKNDWISTNAADTRLAAGLGDDTYVINNLRSTIVEKAGEGIDTVQAYGEWGYSLAKAGETENLTLMGSECKGALGNDLGNYILGNAGNNVIQGGKGDDILTGGAGHDTFLLFGGDGSDVITDFVTTGAGHDAVTLDGYGFTSFAAVEAAMEQVGADTVLNLGNGETLTFANTKVGSFSAQDFLLPEVRTGWVETFHDGFSGFSHYSQNGGNWLTQREWAGAEAYRVTANGEQQLYVDTTFKGLPGTQAKTALGLDPFTVSNGELTITAAPIDASIKSYTGNATHTSGVITSEASFVQTYGHFEITTQLAGGAGAWDAFWLRPVSNVGAAEIDVLEAFGNQPDAFHVAIHSDTSSQGDGAWVLTGVDLTQGLHTYGVTWTPYDILFSIDGTQVARYATPTDMNSSMYMIANLAMGGYWPGAAGATQASNMVIDAISAYQLPEYTLAGYTLKTSGLNTQTFTGTARVETITGTSENDLIIGNGGADTFLGGAGDDVYVVSAAATKVTEAFDNGVDTVKSSISFTLGANIENLTLTGASSLTATGNDQANIIVGNAGANVITGGKGGDILTGGGGVDTFVIGTDTGSDIITDFATTGTSHDVLKLVGLHFSTLEEVKSAMTQVGSDVYFQINSTDTVVLRGTTIAAFTAADFAFPTTLATSATSLRWDVGTAGADTIVGTSSNETLQGKGGADLLYGGKGDDIYFIDNLSQVAVEKAGEGVDTVLAGAAGYTLPANIENLTMLAAGKGTGNDWSNGILGTKYNDTIDGKGGNDRITGNAGNDIFVHAAGSGYDTITDFHVYKTANTEHDQIKFTGYGPNATLSHVGDVWTIRSAMMTDTIVIAGVTSLGVNDYVFA